MTKSVTKRPTPSARAAASIGKASLLNASETRPKSDGVAEKIAATIVIIEEEDRLDTIKDNAIQLKFLAIKEDRLKIDREIGVLEVAMRNSSNRSRPEIKRQLMAKRLESYGYENLSFDEQNLRCYYPHMGETDNPLECGICGIVSATTKRHQECDTMACKKCYGDEHQCILCSQLRNIFHSCSRDVGNGCYQHDVRMIFDECTGKIRSSSNYCGYRLDDGTIVCSNCKVMDSGSFRRDR